MANETLKSNKKRGNTSASFLDETEALPQPQEQTAEVEQKTEAISVPESKVEKEEPEKEVSPKAVEKETEVKVTPETWSKTSITHPHHPEQRRIRGMC